MAGIDINTLLLLRGESLRDFSYYNVNVSNQNVSLSSTHTKFGGKSLYFNGNAKFSLPSSFKFNFYSGDFTIDWWGYQTTRVNEGDPFFFAPVGVGHFGVHILSQNYSLWYTNAYGGTVLCSEKLNQWSHYAFVKNGSQLLFFENGIKTFTGSSTVIPTQDGYVMCVGGRSDIAQYYTGYMDEFRVSNVARWTQNFTPPKERYTDERNIYVKINGTWRKASNFYVVK